MTKNIKEFIEQNIELLETDLVEFFKLTYEQARLDRADIAYMASLLSDAGIDDIDLARECALLGIIDTQVADWSLADAGVSSMPLYEFIEVFLDACVGFDENYVLLLMKRTAKRWERYAKLYMLHDMTVIERV